MDDGRTTANKRRAKISDQELAEVCKTMTIDEIAQKYEMHPQQVRRRCREGGFNPVGYKNPNYRSIAMASVNARGLRGPGGSNHTIIWGEYWHYISSQAETFNSKHPDFEYIETRRKHSSTRVRLKCRKCSSIIERAASTIRTKGIECEFCKEQNEIQKELQEGRIKLMRFFNALAESKKPKHCEYCGTEFFSQSPYAKYCSEKCKRKNRGGSIRKRCRKYGALYDPSVKPIKVFERDGYVCQICGIACNDTDRTWGSFGPYAPTVDHILALANGGQHTWDNVQCVHAICNSYKRDLIV